MYPIVRCFTWMRVRLFISEVIYVHHSNFVRSFYLDETASINIVRYFCMDENEFTF